MGEFQVGYMRICLLIACACASCSSPQETGQANVVMPEDWKIVEAYLVLDRAWQAREREIRAMHLSDEEKDVLRRQTRGGRPDVALAALAAKRMIEDDAGGVLQAAEFLAQHTSASPMQQANVLLGYETLSRLIGPDWSRIVAFRQATDEWREAMEAILASESSEREKHLLMLSIGEQPQMSTACAAALAILDQGIDHPRLLDAAEFLLMRAVKEAGADMLLSRAARAISIHFPHYGDWPRMLEQLAHVQPPRDSVDEFIRGMAAHAPDPEVRAAAERLLRLSLGEA